MSVNRMAWLIGLAALALAMPAPSLWAAGNVKVCGFTGGDPGHGAKIYRQACVACHGANGHGAIPGTPDFTKKGGALSKPHSALESHIKDGFSNPGAPMAMPPGGGNPALTDQNIRDVHAYLHKAFGCG